MQPGFNFNNYQQNPLYPQQALPNALYPQQPYYQQQFHPNAQRMNPQQPYYQQQFHPNVQRMNPQQPAYPQQFYPSAPRVSPQQPYYQQQFHPNAQRMNPQQPVYPQQFHPNAPRVNPQQPPRYPQQQPMFYPSINYQPQVPSNMQSGLLERHFPPNQQPMRMLTGVPQSVPQMNQRFPSFQQPISHNVASSTEDDYSNPAILSALIEAGIRNNENFSFENFVTALIKNHPLTQKMFLHFTRNFEFSERLTQEITIPGKKISLKNSTFLKVFYEANPEAVSVLLNNPNYQFDKDEVLELLLRALYEGKHDFIKHVVRDKRLIPYGLYQHSLQSGVIFNFDELFTRISSLKKQQTDMAFLKTLVPSRVAPAPEPMEATSSAQLVVEDVFERNLKETLRQPYYKYELEANQLIDQGLKAGRVFSLDILLLLMLRSNPRLPLVLEHLSKHTPIFSQRYTGTYEVSLANGVTRSVKVKNATLLSFFYKLYPKKAGLLFSHSTYQPEKHELYSLLRKTFDGRNSLDGRNEDFVEGVVRHPGFKEFGFHQLRFDSNNAQQVARLKEKIDSYFENLAQESSQVAVMESQSSAPVQNPVSYDPNLIKALIEDYLVSFGREGDQARMEKLVKELHTKVNQHIVDHEGKVVNLLRQQNGFWRLDISDGTVIDLKPLLRSLLDIAKHRRSDSSSNHIELVAIVYCLKAFGFHGDITSHIPLHEPREAELINILKRVWETVPSESVLVENPPIVTFDPAMMLKLKMSELKSRAKNIVKFHTNEDVLTTQLSHATRPWLIMENHDGETLIRTYQLKFNENGSIVRMEGKSDEAIQALLEDLLGRTGYSQCKMSGSVIEIPSYLKEQLARAVDKKLSEAPGVPPFFYDTKSEKRSEERALQTHRVTHQNPNGEVSEKAWGKRKRTESAIENVEPSWEETLPARKKPNVSTTQTDLIALTCESPEAALTDFWATTMGIQAARRHMRVQDPELRERLLNEGLHIEHSLNYPAAMLRSVVRAVRPEALVLGETPMSYQRVNIQKILDLKKSGIGGAVLADEMGLGKTVQFLALLLNELSTTKKPALVVSPATTAPQTAANFREKIIQDAFKHFEKRVQNCTQADEANRIFTELECYLKYFSEYQDSLKKGRASVHSGSELTKVTDLKAQFKGFQNTLYSSFRAHWDPSHRQFAPIVKVNPFSTLILCTDKKSLDQALQSLTLNSEKKIILTTHTLFSTQENLDLSRFGVVVADEAHSFDNKSTNMSEAFKKLLSELPVDQVPFVLLVTGTPIENGLEDFITLARFINPMDEQERIAFDKVRDQIMLLDKNAKDSVTAHINNPTKVNFAETYQALVSAFAHVDAFRSLFKRQTCRETKLSPEVKAAWGNTIPTKNVHTLGLELTSERQKIRAAELEKNESTMSHFTFQTGIEQMLMHPDFINLTAQDVGMKVKNLVKGPELTSWVKESAMLNEIIYGPACVSRSINEKKPTIIFVHHIESGNVIKALIEKEYGLPEGSVSFLHGDTKNKQELVQKFNNKSRTEPNILILSLRAGGTGVDLPKAELEIFAADDFNPAIIQQAEDRGNRVGGPTGKILDVIKFDCGTKAEARLQEIKKGKELLQRFLLTQPFSDQQTVADNFKTFGEALIHKLRLPQQKKNAIITHFKEVVQNDRGLWQRIENVYPELHLRSEEHASLIAGSSSMDGRVFRVPQSPSRMPLSPTPVQTSYVTNSATGLVPSHLAGLAGFRFSTNHPSPSNFSSPQSPVSGEVF